MHLGAAAVIWLESTLAHEKLRGNLCLWHRKVGNGNAYAPIQVNKSTPYTMSSQKTRAYAGIITLNTFALSIHFGVLITTKFDFDLPVDKSVTSVNGDVCDARFYLEFTCIRPYEHLVCSSVGNLWISFHAS